MEIMKVDDSEGIAKVVSLAREIWHQHFIPIIGKDQVEYMLAKFQSESSIALQIQSGWQYYLACCGDHFAGYTGLVPDKDNKRLMLSKLYVRRNDRHMGVGSQFLQFIDQQCRMDGFDVIWLTVNRHNHDTIDWYHRHDFVTVDEVKKDIGNGYFMDDFVMEKRISF